jgi:hypothetical protein
LAGYDSSRLLPVLPEQAYDGDVPEIVPSFWVFADEYTRNTATFVPAGTKFWSMLNQMSPFA